MPFTGILSDKLSQLILQINTQTFNLYKIYIFIRFGRLTVLVIGMTGNSVFGILKAFAPNYYFFMLVSLPTTIFCVEILKKNVLVFCVIFVSLSFN